MRKIIASGLVVLVCVIGSYAMGIEKLHIEGSTTVGPIVDGFAEVFKDMYPDVVITVNKSGSDTGAAALVDSRCDISTMSRFMREKEFMDSIAKGVFPVAHLEAIDGVCIVVHPSNPVCALTTGQVRDIYLGKIKNWNQVGGPRYSAHSQ